MKTDVDLKARIIREASRKNCHQDNYSCVCCAVMIEHKIPSALIIKELELESQEDIIYLVDSYNEKALYEDDNKPHTHIDINKDQQVKYIDTGGFSDEDGEVPSSVKTERQLVYNYLKYYLK